jgi:hypothetical protein
LEETENDQQRAIIREMIGDNSVYEMDVEEYEKPLKGP